MFHMKQPILHWFGRARCRYESRGEQVADVTITEDSNFEHLRNKTFEAGIELKQIQRMSAPELSDEVAVDLGYESTDDMRSKVAEEISSGKEENLKNQARVQIFNTW